MNRTQVAQVLELRRAGVSFKRIAEQLEVTAQEAEAAFSEAIQHLPVEKVRALEVDRLDRLQQAVWTKATQGDIPSVDRAIKLSELRMRLAGAPMAGSPMQEAFEATVKTLAPAPADVALIEAGRWVVRQIDAAANSGDPVVESKAVFMVPHLVNILRELGATPQTREEMRTQAEAAAQVRTDNDLERFRKRRSARRSAGD